MGPEARTYRLSDHLLARNVLWNLAGYGLPALVAVPVAPVLIHALGTDRFGVLALSWALIGYSGWFDLGLGRALTQAVASRLLTPEGEDVGRLVRTAVLLLLAVAIGACLFVLLSAPWFITQILRAPVKLREESMAASRLLALSLPFVVTYTGLRGVLEARQQFHLVNAVRIPLGVMTFLGPVLALPFTHSLVGAVGALALVRIAGWTAQLILCLYSVPELRRSASLELAMIRPLIRFGGWLTISNLITPFMVYLDRFLIGGVVSVAGVTYYATPYEVVTKMGVIVSALTGVLFPAFATTFIGNRRQMASLFSTGVKYTFLGQFPLSLIVLTLAGPILGFWLGPDFSRHSTLVLQVLTLGVFVNNLAQIPSTLLQAIGRPDVTAKLQAAELPFYLVALWFGVTTWGITGAALAWTARVFADAFLLFFFTRRVAEVGLAPTLWALASLALVVLALPLLPVDLAFRAMFLVIVLSVFGVGSWRRLLSQNERDLGFQAIRALVQRSAREGTN